MSQPLPKGVLVAFEGIDGSGKTTQASMLEDWAEGFGINVVRTKEPTAGKWGARVRESKFAGRLTPEEELECFMNDRREHVQTVLAPELARGSLVIVDRYYYSTVAYQGARGLNPRELLTRNREFAPVPDLVFLLDLDPRVGLDRIRTRGIGQDLFETVDELSRARAVFRSLEEPHVKRIDGTRPIPQVHAAVLFHLLAGPLYPWMRSQTFGGSTEPVTAESIALLETANRIAHDESIPDEIKAHVLAAFARGLRAHRV